MIRLILGVFCQLISNPLGDKRYLLSIFSKSKMAAIKPIFGNIPKESLIFKKELFLVYTATFLGSRGPLKRFSLVCIDPIL